MLIYQPVFEVYHTKFVGHTRGYQKYNKVSHRLQKVSCVHHGNTENLIDVIYKQQKRSGTKTLP